MKNVANPRKPRNPRRPPRPRKPRQSRSPDAPASFAPIVLRPRRDSWTAERQVAFIMALAESGCVIEACRQVGMGRASAYALLMRNDSVGFRAAWDAALEMAIGALGDAAQSRALNGVARPVVYKGGQIGERVYYDERLTMFLLKTRDPERFGVWRDRFVFDKPREPKAQRLAALCERVAIKAVEDELGVSLIEPTPKPPATPDDPLPDLT
jgi:hypothetical protein